MFELRAKVQTFERDNQELLANCKAGEDSLNQERQKSKKLEEELKKTQEIEKNIHKQLIE